MYDIPDRDGIRYEKTDSATIVAEMSVYGNTSVLSVAVDEQQPGTEWTVAMVHSCTGLSDEGVRRAIPAVADSIAQHPENEWVMKRTASGRNAL